ncbi:hypothetical protein RJ640_020878 [Escallonia rubra]|uniref:DNA-directed RNA polymerase subunit n=1 Tax=Escallonia rubra TaxID=112253 RepID=A0AA88QN16_9ASTE|nr:hypothetical protein RJ640_020878 [Escallonia rubra]
MEGLKVSDANLVVYLHPSKAKIASQAIFRELSSILFKFNETFDGVVLAYEVNILSNSAKILPAIHPHFGVRLKAKLLLFHPKPDMLLEGKVVKLGQQSIHIIVLGFSSATIIQEDIQTPHIRIPSSAPPPYPMENERKLQESNLWASFFQSGSALAEEEVN